MSLDLRHELAGSPVVAMITEPDAPAVPDVVTELSAGGIRAVEITLTTPGALDAVRRSVATGTALIGAGTILTTDLARQAVDAGADYLLTPGVIPDVLAESARLGVPTVCGAFTLTEVLTAWQLGATLVKLFPAWLGGPAYVTALSAAFPHIPIVPTGGVEPGNIASFFRAGAAAVAVGRPLIGDSLRTGNATDVKRRAAEILSIAR
jgi:2-dehydro-3-deoxyphosphogluconate aldolase/(4S)-4-hydroxy-2-oxoglutarate aldolase